MLLLIVGLVIFAVIHFVPSFPGVKSAMKARLGEMGYRGVFSGIALLGLVLMIYGYSEAQPDSAIAWDLPTWGRSVNHGLMLIVFILLAASGIRGNIANYVRHPMSLGVIIWCIAHLLANDTMADVVLFGGILAWAIVAIIFAFIRNNVAEIPTGAIAVRNDIVAIVVGTLIYMLIVWKVHEWLIGVQPIP